MRIDGRRIDTRTTVRGVVDFRALRPGRYVVAVDPMSLSDGYAFDGALEQEVDLRSSAYEALSFPLLALRAIGGTVYLDSDGNRSLGERDRPAAGIAVTLSDGQRRLTDDEGRFLFRNLDEGTYHVYVEGVRRPQTVHLRGGPVDRLDLHFLIVDE